MRCEALLGALCLLVSSIVTISAAEAARAEAETVTGSPVVFFHGEKHPAGRGLNDLLGLPDAVSPAALIQIGDDVYLDANGDGNAEMVVAHAHHDGTGRVIAGLAPGVASADQSLYRAEQRDVIVAGLRGLAQQFDAGRLSEADYRLAQARWLVGLQADSFGVTEGLEFLQALWEEALISPLCYGIKRHEMLDAL